MMTPGWDFAGVMKEFDLYLVRTLMISKMRKHKRGLPCPGGSQNAETKCISFFGRFRWIINFPYAGNKTYGTAHFEFGMLSGLI